MIINVYTGLPPHKTSRQQHFHQADNALKRAVARRDNLDSACEIGKGVGSDLVGGGN